MAPSAGVLDHPLQVPQARIGTRRHHRDRERRDRRGKHRGRPADRIYDSTVGRASSVARARALYPAHPGSPALAAPCACTRFQRQQQRQGRFALIPQLRAQACRALQAVRSEGSGQGSGRGSAAQQAHSAARARGSGRAGRVASLAVASADAGEPCGGRLVVRIVCLRGACGAGGGWRCSACARPSHRCRARWAERAPAVLLRRQCRGLRGALRGMRDR